MESIRILSLKTRFKLDTTISADIEEILAKVDLQFQKEKTTDHEIQYAVLANLDDMIEVTDYLSEKFSIKSLCYDPTRSSLKKFSKPVCQIILEEKN